MGRLKDITSKLLTLSYPKYRFFLFSFVLFFLMIIPVSFLEAGPKTICSRVLGKYCFSEGITRGVSLLLKGQFSSAMNYNFLALPVLIILILFISYDIFYLIKNKKK